jgi:hypothetical protein
LLEHLAKRQQQLIASVMYVMRALGLWLSHGSPFLSAHPQHSRRNLLAFVYITRYSTTPGPKSKEERLNFRLSSRRLHTPHQRLTCQTVGVVIGSLSFRSCFAPLPAGILSCSGKTKDNKPIRIVSRAAQ